MLDIKFIRENPERVQQAAQQKGYQVDVAHVLELDENRRELQTKADHLRQARNDAAAQLKSGGKPTEEQLVRGRELKTQIAEVEDRLRVADQEYLAALKKVPNMPLDSVPIGASENDNVVTKTVGQPTQFDFEPKNHWQIAEARGWIDKERAAKVAGSRFAYVKGDLVLLHWAVLQFATGILTNPETIKKIATQAGLGEDFSNKPFIPVLPPAMIRTEVYEATARLNAEEQTYKLADDDLWLNASAEHSLVPMYKDEIINEADLPIRYVGYTTAFRREAGTYGKDMEGIFRLHQFDKLEIESFATPETAHKEHLLMVAVQEYLMSQLGLPYNVVTKCTADIGGANAAGVDIDTWLPGQGKYRETHTADYMTDYQARRLNTRVRRADGTVELLHTNDATAFSQRPLIAIVENYQQADGTVAVPEVLRAFLGGRAVL